METTYIRLTEDFDLGHKVLSKGRIVSFNLGLMRRLVKEKRAYFCTQKGLRVAHVVDEEE